MKLQLTIPALERLIGGDTEIEVDLRKQIVHEFAKRHLKNVADEEIHKAAVDEVKKHVNAAAKEAFDINGVLGATWPDASRRLESMVKSVVESSVQQIVDEALAKVIQRQNHYWTQQLADVVDRAVHRDIEKLVEQGIQKRLKAAIDK